jgi:hypothetical protein
MECPRCDEVTKANLLADGTNPCSCVAERTLPLAAAQGTPWDGAGSAVPAPRDHRAAYSSRIFASRMNACHRELCSWKNRANCSGVFAWA